jgi:hypothetical protein
LDVSDRPKEEACEDWECRQQKEELLIFGGSIFGGMVCGMEGGTTGWNNQRNK